MGIEKLAGRLPRKRADYLKVRRTKDAAMVVRIDAAGDGHHGKVVSDRAAASRSKSARSFALSCRRSRTSLHQANAEERGGTMLSPLKLRFRFLSHRS